MSSSIRCPVARSASHSAGVVGSSVASGSGGGRVRSWSQALLMDRFHGRGFTVRWRTCRPASCAIATAVGTHATTTAARSVGWPSQWVSFVAVRRHSRRARARIVMDPHLSRPAATPTLVRPVPARATDLLCTARAGQFAFSESRHHAPIALHAHEHPTVTMLLDGAFEESYRGRRTESCETASVLFRPAGELHADRFGRDGALNLVIEVEPARVEMLRGYTGALEELVHRRDAALDAIALFASPTLPPRPTCIRSTSRGRSGTTSVRPRGPTFVGCDSCAPQTGSSRRPTRCHESRSTRGSRTRVTSRAPSGERSGRPPLGGAVRATDGVAFPSTPRAHAACSRTKCGR